MNPVALEADSGRAAKSPFQFVKFALWGLLSLVLTLVGTAATAGTFDGAMGRTNYKVLSGDVNGDGKVDLLMKAIPVIVTIPLDDDLIVPIPIPVPSPSFVLLSDVNGNYTLTSNPDAQLLAFAAWQSGGYELTFRAATGTLAGSVSIKATAANLPSFDVSMSGSTGVLQLASTTPPLGTASSSTPIAVAITPPFLSNPDAGTLDGTLDVGADGAATYNLHLVVPPGTAGMEPALSLNYSSNGANASVGLGWSLEGLSTIHRCTKTVAQDNTPGRIAFDNADRLCLDGKRLIRVNGGNPGTDFAAIDSAYWVANAEYRTEQETFTRITRLANGGFKVESRDGRVSYYGIDSALGSDRNSAIAAQGRTDGQPLVWALARVEDRVGNYMTVRYSTDASTVNSDGNLGTGEYLPVQIRYGGNSTAGLASDLAVSFEYEARPDNVVQYFGGSHNDLRSRLTHVKTFVDTGADGNGGVLVRDHTIHYVTSANSGRSLVDWMQACAINPNTGGSECLPRTNFESGVRLPGSIGWKKVPDVASFTLPSYGINDGHPVATAQGNFDGSGLTSYMIAVTNNSPYTPMITGYFKMRLPNGAVNEGFFDVWRTQSQFSQVSAVDLNSDGLDDLLLSYPLGGIWSYCINTTVASTQITFSCSATVWKGATNVVDLHGDRKPHILSSFVGGGSGTDCFLVGSTMQCQPISITTDAAAPIWKIDLVPTKFGHGGYTDYYASWDNMIPALDPNNAYVAGTCNYVSDVGISTSQNGCDRYRGAMTCFTGQTGISCKVIFQERFQKVTAPFSVVYMTWPSADVNGDGLTDYVYWQSSTGSTTSGSYICTSKEVGIDCKRDTLDIWGWPADWFGDGVARYLSRPTPFTFKTCRYGLSAICENFNVPPTVTGQWPLAKLGIVADLSGHDQWLHSDGIPVADSASTVWTPYSLADAPALDRMIRIRNGLGQVEEVDYAFGNDSAVYSRSAVVDGVTKKAIYPQMAVPPGTLVKQLRRANGQGGWLRSSYSYAGAMAHAQGRGSLGFTSMNVTGPTGTSIVTTHSQEFPFTGMVTRSRTIASDGTVLDDTANTLERQNFTLPNGTQTVLAYAKQTVSVKRDLDGSELGTTTTVNQLTDGWGNSNRQDVTVVGGGKTFVVTLTKDYLNDGLAWLIGLPTHTTLSKKVDAGIPLVRTTDFAYDLITGLRKTETTEPGNTLYQVISTLDRSNAFGQVNKKTLAWIDPITRANKTRLLGETIFDARGRFGVTVKNALGHTEQNTYAPGTGARLRSIGPNNLLTVWTADGFGRVNKELRADGNETRWYTKSCVSSVCALNAVVAQITESFHGADRINAPLIKYIDSLGHMVRTQTWGFDGRSIVADQRYDDFGRAWEMDFPRFDAETAYLSSRNFYDELNRNVKTVTRDEGGTDRESTTVYNGMTTLLTNAKMQKRTEKRDVISELVSVQDANLKVTSFSQDPFGNLTQTIDPNGNVIKVEYDLMGRRTVLDDPDLGRITYTIDPIGQIVAQVSPKQSALGQQTTFSYDDLGRMTARYETDLESHWTFDTAVNGIGKLAEAYTMTGITKDYRRELGYDSFGRNSFTKLTLSDGSYISRPDYDAWGRLIRQTYQRNGQASKIFDMRYNSSGYQSTLERGSTVLWRANAKDASLQSTMELLGNGLTRSTSYNPNTNRLQDARILTAANAVRLQEGYNYDVLGNVGTRWQYWDADGFQESFSYDNLNRIATSTVLNQPVQNFTYDDAGNILTKTGVGTGAYVYPIQGQGAKRPHGVVSIPGIGAFGYDENGNLTSGAGRTLSWSSFDMPLEIKGTSASASFKYGPEHQRVFQQRGDGSQVIYAGAQEVEVAAGTHGVTVKTYWPGGVGVEIDRYGIAKTELNWTHQDRLGSPIAITDEAGALREKLAFDTWGRRRATNGAIASDSLDGVVDNRGFTGHEMLDQLDLVHMNGRVYDPLVGKFLSGDLLLQDPYNGQNYNRYSYVLNNPTNLTDPTGYAWQEFVPVYGSVLLFSQAVGAGHFGTAALYGGMAIFDGATLGVGSLVTAPAKMALMAGVKAELRHEAAAVLAKEATEHAAQAAARAVKAGEQAAAKQASERVAAAESKGAATAAERANVTAADIRKSPEFKKSRQKALAENGGICELCQKNKATQGDHFKPAKKFADQVNRGEKTLQQARAEANAAENVIGACGGKGGCNPSKGAKTASPTPGEGKWVPSYPTEKIKTMMEIQ